MVSIRGLGREARTSEVSVKVMLASCPVIASSRGGAKAMSNWVSGMGRPNGSKGLVEAVLVSINGYRMVNCDDPVTRIPWKLGELRL